MSTIATKRPCQSYGCNHAEAPATRSIVGFQASTIITITVPHAFLDGPRKPVMPSAHGAGAPEVGPEVGAVAPTAGPSTAVRKLHGSQFTPALARVAVSALTETI